LSTSVFASHRGSPIESKNGAFEFIAGTAAFFANDNIVAGRDLPNRGDGLPGKLLSKLWE
jgi:hypothetical protein